mmetsp:Transcript_101378/g.285975  ORF Transcript_101378/g.285975 Transcript_101378/m.285975 type:complete len:271 (+) Transcript_101378:1344-2156(+)
MLCAASSWTASRLLPRRTWTLCLGLSRSQGVGGATPARWRRTDFAADGANSRQRSSSGPRWAGNWTRSEDPKLGPWRRWKPTGVSCRARWRRPSARRCSRASALRDRNLVASRALSCPVQCSMGRARTQPVKRSQWAQSASSRPGRFRTLLAPLTPAMSPRASSLSRRGSRSRVPRPPTRRARHSSRPARERWSEGEPAGVASRQTRAMPPAAPLEKGKRRAGHLATMARCPGRYPAMGRKWMRLSPLVWAVPQPRVIAAPNWCARSANS